MAKITELAVLTGASVAASDLLALVDVSDTSMAASGTDKKITAAETAIGLHSVGLAAYLGKLTPAGLSGAPTFFNPLAAAWDDSDFGVPKGWVQFLYSTSGIDIFIGTGDGSGPSMDIFAEYSSAAISMGGGSGGTVVMEADSGSDGQAVVVVQPSPDQVTDLLLIGAMLEVTPTTLAFYGVSPIAQQTGVAVSAAGIHAALVSLGLFTA